MGTIYRCKNNCHISDHQKRCPRCGEWLLEAGEDRAAIEADIQANQIYHAQDLKYNPDKILR